MRLWFTLALLVPAAAGAEIIDRVAAVVDDKVITLSEVEERAQILRAQLRDRDRPLRKEALDDLVAEKLFEKQLRELAIDVPDAELSIALDDVRKQNGLESEEQLAEAVRRQGLDWDEYKETMRRQLAQMKLINLKVRSRVKVSDDEVKRRWAELTAGEKGEIELKVSQLLVRVPADAPADVVAEKKARAEALLSRAKAGEEFAALARAESDDSSKENGGDLGWFRRGEMVKEHDAAAFALDAGQVAGPIRTRYGWHLLRVDEKRNAAVKPLEELQDKIREGIYREELDRQTRRYVDELKRAALIDYKLAELKPDAAPAP